MRVLSAFVVLSVAVSTVAVPAAEAQSEDPDATRAGAVDLGEISSLGDPQFPPDTLDGVDDAVDYYRFRLADPATVGLGLRRLDVDADLHLEDDSGEMLAQSANAGLTDEWIERDLPAGDYYARIESRAAGPNSYIFRYGAELLADGTVLRLVLSSTEPGRLDIGWHPASPPPSEYRVNWAKAGESFPTWTDESGNAYPADARHTLKGLEPGAEYKVRVRSRYEGADPGPWSQEVHLAVSEENQPLIDARDKQPQNDEQSQEVTRKVTRNEPTEPAGVLVSTLGQSLDGAWVNFGNGGARAQVFGTGPSLSGVDLESVSVRFQAVHSSARVGVSVWSVDDDFRPASRLFALRSPVGGVAARRVNVFAAPEGSMLDPDSWYAVVVADNGSREQTTQLILTNSDDVDEGAASGWAVRSGSLALGGHESWGDAAWRTGRVLMAVNGVTRDFRSRVEFAGDSYLAVEGGSAVVDLRLDLASEADFVVPITATPLGGASAADFVVPASVSFSAGDERAQFALTAVDDGVSDPGEGVLLSLGTLPEGLEAGDTTEATVSIFDGVAVRVGFTSGGSFGAVEGEEVEVGVSLSRDPGREVVVPITVRKRGGASDADFSGVPESVTFASGETDTTFTVTATDDSEDDDGESLLLGFGDLPLRVSADGVADTATVRLDDNDAPDSVTVSWDQSRHYVAEGASVVLSATLSDDPERTVTVPVTTTRSSSTGTDDYSLSGTSLNFGAGQRTATVVLSATDDTDADDGDWVRLSFGTLPTGVTSGTPASTTVTINSSLVMVRNLGQTVSGRESLTDVRFVNVGGGVQSPQGIPVSRHVGFRTGSHPTGYELDLVRVRFSHSDAANTGIPSVDVPALDASIVRQNGTKVADLGLPPRPFGGALNGIQRLSVPAGTELLPDTVYRLKLKFDSNRGSTTIWIPGTPNTDFDVGSQPGWELRGENLYQIEVRASERAIPEVRASFAAATYSVTEGDSVTVTVNLSADPDREVEVPITVAPQGGATAADYSGVPGHVTFEPGETAATFTVRTTDDVADDDDESLLLGFGTLPASVTAGDTTAATVSITDDDASDGQTVSVSFVQSAYEVDEGDSVTVTLTLDAIPGRDVRIPITATGQDGATAADYSGVPQHVTIAADRTRASFRFAAAPDGTDDDDESVLLALGTLPANVQAGGTATATVSIIDDDLALLVANFDQAAHTVTEGQITPITITLSDAPERTVTIPLRAIPQGDTTTDDYTVPANVTFQPYQTTATISFIANDDTEDNDNKSAILTFSDLPDDINTGTTAQTHITITDNDTTHVGFGRDGYDVAEGDEVQVVVLLSAPAQQQIDVPIEVTALGGASAADYSGVPQSVTFEIGQSRATFALTAVDDDVDDDGESLVIGFGDLPSGVFTDHSAEPSSTTVRLVDDDVPASVEVSFAASAYNVAEGMTVAVEVVLSDDPERELVVPITATPQGDASSADFSVPASVRFEPGQTSAVIEFSASSDTESDDAEQVELAFGTLPAHATAGSVSTSTVMINEQLVLISNLGQTTSDSADLVTGGTLSRLSVGFVTGSHPAGYDLHSIRALMSHSSVSDSGVPADVDSPLLARIVRGASQVAQLTVPSGALADVVTLAAPAGTKLLAGTEYRVEFWFAADPGQTTVKLPATTSGDADPGAGIGWEFSASPRLQIEVRGSVRAIPEVSISFAEDAYEVDEGGSVTVTVNLSEDPDREVQVPITVAPQGGATAADYSGVPDHVTFGPGETTATFTVSATDDVTDDDDEGLLVGFGPLPASVTAGDTTAATVSITDDDASEGSGGVLVSTLGQSLNGARVGFGWSEGWAQVFGTGPSLSGVDLESVSVRFQTVHSSARVGVSVWSVDDDFRPAERLFALRSPVGGVAAGRVNVFAAPEGSMLDPDSWYAVVGIDDWRRWQNTQLVLTNSDGVDGGAAEGWAVRSGSLKLARHGSWGDAAWSTGRVLLAVNGVTRDVRSRVEFASDSYLAVEGGSAVVELRLDRPSEIDFVVPITATPLGGASAADFVVPASVSFSAGDERAQFALAAVDDGVSDPGEGVLLSLGTLPEGFGAGDATEATVSIFDGVAVRVGFTSGGSFGAVEGEEVEVGVSLSRDPGREVVVPITVTKQGGASDADFSGVPESVTFASGETDTSFTVTATDDSDDDDGESLLLGFGDLPLRVSADGVADTATVRLDDNDAPDSVTVSWDQSRHYVAEGDSVVISATLSDDPERTLSVPVTTTRSSSTGTDDFSLSGTTLSFAAGQRTATVVLSATDDTDADDGDWVRLSFGTLPTGVTSGTPASTTVTINSSLVMVRNLGQTVSGTVALTDLQFVTVTPCMRPPCSTTLEGVPVARHMDFVTGSHPTGYELDSVRVRFSHSDAANTGIPSVDVPALDASIVRQNGTKVADLGLPPRPFGGELSGVQTLSVPAGTELLPDTVYRLKLLFDSNRGIDERVRIPSTPNTDTDVGSQPGWEFRGAGHFYQIEVRASARAIPEVSASFAAATYSVTEGDSVTVTVNLSADPDREVEVPITVAPQGGATAADFSGVPGHVTFEPGETAATFTVRTTDDVADDDDESLLLGFGTLPASVTAGDTTTATVSITDDDESDDQTVSVSFVQSAYEVDEGDSVTVTLTLDAIPGRDVRIPITATGQDGATAADYSGVPQHVTIAADRTRASFRFAAAPDGTDDDDESVLLALGTLPANVQAGGTATATVSIIDDDLALLVANFDQAAHTVTEGQITPITITLSDAPERTVTIPLRAIPQGDTTTDDYTVPANVTFQPYQTTATISFIANDDTEDNDNKSAILTFSDLPDDINTGTTAQTHITITDNDTVVTLFEHDLRADVLTDGVAIVDTRAGASTHFRSAIDKPGDVDWFKITLAAGTKYRFALKGLNSTGELTLADPLIIGIYTGPDGYVDGTLAVPLNRRETRTDGVLTQMHYVAAADGDHWVAVRGVEDATGIYDLRVLRVGDDNTHDDPDTTQIISPGLTRRGAIDHPGDVDWYRASLVAGTTYEAAIAPDGGTGPCLDVGVRDADGQQLRRDEKSRQCALTYFTPTQTGDYFFVVYSDSNQSWGYSLTLTESSG